MEIAILLVDKGKWKEYAIYPKDDDGTINNCTGTVRINTEKETIEDYINSPREFEMSYNECDLSYNYLF